MDYLSLPLDTWENINMEDVSEHIKEHGVSGIEEFFKAKLERWKDVEINICITGVSGAGKSSFINAIRGLADDDERAALTGVTEITTEPKVYPHPTNSKIKFWDLPGIGTPNYPNLETYCDSVGLAKYDTFLILTIKRFTENDRLLARKVRSLNKSFFFVRTHIDVDYQDEKRKRTFNEEEMLENVIEDGLKNLESFQVSKESVFLISNYHPAKWDFGRLTQAILDVLPSHQKECLTLSLSALTSLSTAMLKRKAQVLRGRIWMVASISALAGLVPLPGLNFAVDLTLITKEVSFYKSQLGLPDQDSYRFREMTPENQDIVRKFCFTCAEELTALLAPYVSETRAEELSRFSPFVGKAIAGGFSFSSTYYTLHQCLNALEKTAVAFLKTTSTNTGDDFHRD